MPKRSTGGVHSVVKVTPMMVQPQSSQHGELSFSCSDDSSLQQLGCWQHDLTSTTSVQQVVSAPVVVLTRQQQSGIVNASARAKKLVSIPRR